MKVLLTNANVFIEGSFKRCDVALDNGRVVGFFKNGGAAFGQVIDLKNKYILPGFVDVHVHLREPGFFYKESIKTGTLAASSAGYTSVFAMPNLNPVPDCPENLEKELEIIKRDAVINVYPYAAITEGENGAHLTDFNALYGKAIAFSDDGRGVQDGEIMRRAMTEAAKLGAVIAAHAEDNTLLEGGYIHKGKYAAAHGHKGISSESEWSQVARDVRLAEETGVKYHVCHVSTKESVKIIREAKKRGVDVTAETAPHYLTLCEDDLQEDGRFKMNPPLRSAEDKFALIEGIKDGAIDMIATDHAPHSAEEKSRGLKDSLMGVTGLETAFPILYTKLVKSGVIGLEKLVTLMSVNPAARFGLKCGLNVGEPADFTVYDLDSDYIIDPDKFISKGKSTPFAGERVYGKCVLTVCNGRIVWNTIEK